MRQTVQVGRIAGIPVRLHWSVWVILVLLTQVLATVVLPAGAPGYSVVAYWTAAAGFAGLFLATIVIHEVAHARVAHHYGVPVGSITLWAIGGVSELGAPAPRPRAELLIALAGPAASLGTAGICGAAALTVGLAGAGPLQVSGFFWVAGVNLLMAVFNLLPGAPLDGGRVLAAVVWRLRGDRELGRDVAARAGLATGWLIVAGGVTGLVATGDPSWLWPGLIGWFLATSSRSELLSARLLRACENWHAGQVMTRKPIDGHTGQTVAGFLRSAVRHPLHDAYPVVDIDGRLAGLIVVARLIGVPVAARETARLSEVMVPAAAVPCAEPDTPLAEVVAALRNACPFAVVVSDGRPCGVLGSSDVHRVMLLAQLGIGPGPGAATAPELPGAVPGPNR